MEQEQQCSAIRAWFDALNRRDWKAMLALASADVVYEPVRAGESAVYHGRSGVMRFLAEAGPVIGESQIVLDAVKAVGPTRAFARGRAVEANVEFISVHDFDDDGLFAVVSQYFGSDEATLRRVGRI